VDILQEESMTITDSLKSVDTALEYVLFLVAVPRDCDILINAFFLILLYRQARDARAQLIEQRHQVTSTFGKFVGLRGTKRMKTFIIKLMSVLTICQLDFMGAEQLPEVASVLAAIKNKQRKDVLIIGVVISACIIGLFYWWSISSSDLSGTSLT